MLSLTNSSSAENPKTATLGSCFRRPFPPCSNLSTWPLQLTFFRPLHQAITVLSLHRKLLLTFSTSISSPGLSEETYLGFSTSVPKMDLSQPALRVMAFCVCGRRPLGDLHPRLESIPNAAGEDSVCVLTLSPYQWPYRT